MKKYNADVYNFLKSHPLGGYTASELVRHTGRSFSTVRDTLNRMYVADIIGRDMDVGLNGHTIYQWFWMTDEHITQEPPL